MTEDIQQPNGDFLKNYPDVTRVEVIGNDGREFIHYGCSNVKVSLQDDGRTIKVFLYTMFQQKEMTEIEKTEGEIKVLQAKLELLKEMEKHRSPAEEAYKEVYGYYPEVCERSVWVPFQKGYEEAQKDYKVGEYQPTPQTPEQVEQGLRDAMKQAKKDGVFDEPSKPMDDVIDRLENKYKKAEENAASYMTDEVIDRVVKKYQAQKLFDVIRNLGYSVDMCYEIVDAVRCWLPKPQSAVGSQNIDVELLVDGFNDCLKKIKDGLG